MRLNTDDIAFDPKAVTHVRVDKIGGGGGLWWVAMGFADGSTKPEGMFAKQDEAMDLANQLARDWGISVQVNAEVA